MFRLFLIHLTLYAAHAASCGSLPPGSPYMTKGWKLTDIELSNPDAMNEKTTVIEFTCDPKNPSYVNEYNNRSYMLPDQLAGPPVNVGGDITNAFEFLVRDSQSFTEHLAETISESAFFGLFSSSQSKSETASLLASEYVYAGIRESHMAAYEMNLHEPFRADIMRLSGDCQYLVDHLPPTFNDTTFAAYETLINTCGTHYMKQATFGCKFQYKHFTGKGKLDVMASGDVGMNAGLDFRSFLAASGAISGTASGASDNYLSITAKSTACFGGGSACPTDAASFQKWQVTCPNEPAFISGQFNPITDLIRDPKKAESVTLATQNDNNREFLKNDVIPMFNLIIKVVNTLGVGISDTGGTCLQTGPMDCPTGSCQAPFNWLCQCSSAMCPNPPYGPTQADMDADLHQVQNNITTWTTKMDSLITQAQTALQSNIVPNSTIVTIGAEFMYFMSHVQLPITKQECGWNYFQNMGTEHGYLRMSKCQPGDKKNYVYRTITYIQGLF